MGSRRKDETVDEVRVRWREQSRKQYYANLEHSRARSREKARRKVERHGRYWLNKPKPDVYCRRCKTAKAPASGRTRLHFLCDNCRKRCAWCREGFVRPSKKYCSNECYHAARHAAKNYNPAFGRKNDLRYASCLVCRSIVVLHENWKVHPACQKEAQRIWMREFQRRSRYTAIRYWRIADTPEALELAESYFTLRQALRSERGQ